MKLHTTMRFIFLVAVSLLFQKSFASRTNARASLRSLTASRMALQGPKIAEGSSWSGYTSLYTAGKKSFDVKGSCGKSYLKGLHIIRDRENRNDLDRYNMKLLCMDGSVDYMGPYDTSKDLGDWANPDSEDTIVCDGTNNYAVGMWADRWRDEDGDRDSFEFGLFCADNSWWNTGLGYSVGRDKLFGFWTVLATVAGDLVGAIVGAGISCLTTACTGMAAGANIGAAVVGSAASSLAYAGQPSGGDRAEGAAVCGAGTVPRGISGVELVKYRDSDGDWDFYDFQVRCDAYTGSDLKGTVKVTYETCSTDFKSWAATKNDVYAYVDDTDPKKAVKIKVPAPGESGTVVLKRPNGPTNSPRRTTLVTFFTDSGDQDSWCVQNVRVDGELLLGGDYVTTPAYVTIKGPEGSEKSQYTWAKRAASWKWDRVALTYEGCDSGSDCKLYVDTGDSDEKVRISVPDVDEGSGVTEIYGWKNALDKTDKHGGSYSGSITLRNSGDTTCCIKNVGVNGRYLAANEISIAAGDDVTLSDHN